VKNLGLKAFSLLIALLLFVFVRGQSNSAQMSFIAPVEIQNLPSEKVILLPTLRQAQVTVRGPAFLVSQVSAAAPSFRVKLPPLVENRFEAALIPDTLALPPGVEVVGIEPPKIELLLDRRASKAVPVEVPRIGSVNDNLQLVRFEVQPPEVLVSGPETEVKEVRAIETAPVDLRDIKQDTMLELLLRPSWQHTKLVKDSSVVVTIKVTVVSVEKKFSGLPIDIRSREGRQYEISPKRVTVEVSGPRELVLQLSASQIVPYVRLDSLVDGNRAAMVSIDLPESVSLVAIDPEKVEVRKIEAGVQDSAPLSVNGASVTVEALTDSSSKKRSDAK